jgi:predicted metal-binding transcription factor (methanogenesis marker protein 9)
MAKNNRPMVRIHNTETDEIIDREMNDEEYAAWEKQVADNAKAESKAKAKADAKAAVLAKLGLTESEVEALLG